LTEKACRNCHMIVKGDSCPVCKTSALSEDWSGYVIILDPENSTIAKRLKINVPGRYALRVR
jgi:DNA-directed RNA polymerase subunit E"